ncbi:secreted RxLR effector protein 161-like [Stegodyphus dumicola]|uniref:secreted RxLR effector protein 161-like n=1 Tax=Stegodyphus dumicola TaxID=202533 RepID=UPI0015AD8ACA|nr:secreted RxLR effector protein 161-like [Stegodyphus dumicola]
MIEKFDEESPKKLSYTPMTTNFTKNQNNQDDIFPNNQKYREAVGALLYLATVSRPDKANSVGILSRKVEKPSTSDWNGIIKIIRYLRATIHYKLHLKSNGAPVIKAYSDADWAGDTSDRKSTSGYMFQIGNSTVSWTSKKQNCVALSLTEDKYIALALTLQELQWITQLMENLGFAQQEANIIFEDNISCINLSRKEKGSSYNKHIDLKYHYVYDLQKSRNC